MAAPLPAQTSVRSLDLGIRGVGLSIGDSRDWKGIRLNARDLALERTDGLHITLLGPRSGRGDDVRRVAVAGLGMGAVQKARDVLLAGLGIGAGDAVHGWQSPALAWTLARYVAS